MKVVEISGFGGPEVLRVAERDIPTITKDEVLIRVRATGMNHADLAQRFGVYPPPLGASDLMGLEVAGEISEVGSNVTRWRVGDRVCALLPGGGYAQFCAAHQSLCLAIPEGLSFEEAAVTPEAYATVWLNLYMKARLKSGERLLVHGGSSGIGIAAIQLAKSQGAEVWVTAGTDEKCRNCESLGAYRAINYKTEDFEKIIRDELKIRMDVVLDMIGGAYFEKNIHVLAADGRLVYISALGGRHVKLDLVEMMKKRVSIYGSVLRPLEVEAKATILSEMSRVVWPLLESGAVKPVIYKSFSLDQAAEAHELMQTHVHVGKLVLKVP